METYELFFLFLGIFFYFCISSKNREKLKSKFSNVRFDPDIIDFILQAVLFVFAITVIKWMLKKMFNFSFF